VRVTYIGSTCCGALPVDPNLTGQVLEPGSAHSVDVVLGREFTGERAQVDVNIETEPRSSRPIVLTVSGLLVKSVHAHPNPLIVQQTAGTAASAKLRLTRLRSSDIRPLELDQERSDYHGLAMDSVFFSTDQVGNPSLIVPRFVDTVEIDLSLPAALSEGQHQFDCRFAWKNEGLTSTIVPVVVHVSHPYRPVLETVFCGELPRGAAWARAIRMVRNGAPDSLRVAAIRSDVSGVTATFDPRQDNIVLRVLPTASAGRFEARLTLTYSDARVPDFSMKVSGIVQDR
jgi:hypothetical protein